MGYNHLEGAHAQFYRTLRDIFGLYPSKVAGRYITIVITGTEFRDDRKSVNVLHLYERKYRESNIWKFNLFVASRWNNVIRVESMHNRIVFKDTPFYSNRLRLLRPSDKELFSPIVWLIPIQNFQILFCHFLFNSRRQSDWKIFEEVIDDHSMHKCVLRANSWGIY
jgi:hypothetical protein